MPLVFPIRKHDMPKITKRQKDSINWHLETECGCDYAYDPSALSHYFYDGGAEGRYHTFRGGDRILVGGYSSLIKAMMENLPGLKKAVEDKNVIHLKERVVDIEYSNDNDSVGVKVKTARGKSYDANLVVVTLPIGILQRKSNPTLTLARYI
jgi:hypothetical protein